MSYDSLEVYLHTGMKILITEIPSPVNNQSVNFCMNLYLQKLIDEMNIISKPSLNYSLKDYVEQHGDKNHFSMLFSS